MRFISIRIVGLIFVFFHSPICLAQYSGLVSLPPVGPNDSRLLAGAMTLVRSSYQGARDSQAMLLPYFDYAHRNGFFAGVGSGIGYSFINTAQTQAGARVIPQLGRRESASDDLRGMGDVDLSAEGSLYLTHALTRSWTVGGNLRAGPRGGELDIGARRDFALPPATRVSIYGFITAANASSQQTWFGVDDFQARRSGYAAYEPAAGLRNLQIGVSANHFFAQRWVVIGGLSVGQLLGAAEKSPLVQQATHYGSFLALSYRIW